MKKLVILFSVFTIVFTNSVFCQFKIVSIPNGLSYNQSALQIGSTIDSTASIEFSDEVSVEPFIVCTPELEFYELDRNLLVLGTVSESKKRIKLGESRGFQKKEQSIPDLALFFGDNQFTIFGDSVNLELDATTYPLSQNFNIVFAYKIGSEPQAKKIGFDNQTLHLRQSELAQGKTGVNTDGIFQKLSIYSFQPENPQQKKKICTFNLQFVPENTLALQCKAILDTKNPNAPESIKKFINYLYGKTIAKQVESVLSKTALDY
jgi:hypothetical protein